MLGIPLDGILHTILGADVLAQAKSPKEAWDLEHLSVPYFLTCHVSLGIVVVLLYVDCNELSCVQSMIF